MINGESTPEQPVRPSSPVWTAEPDPTLCTPGGATLSQESSCMDSYQVFCGRERPHSSDPKAAVSPGFADDSIVSLSVLGELIRSIGMSSAEGPTGRGGQEPDRQTVKITAERPT